MKTIYIYCEGPKRNLLLTLCYIPTFLTLAFMYALLSVKQGEMPTGSIVVV